jgi:hypothetical protein
MTMKQMFFFDSLLTPKLLLVSYWLSLASAIGVGIYTMISAQGVSIAHILIGIVTLVGIRVSFEMIMIVFKMAEYLRRIAENQPQRDAE